MNKLGFFFNLKIFFNNFFRCCRILFYSTFEFLFLVHHINGGGKSLMLLMLHKTFDFGFSFSPNYPSIFTILRTNY
jgi:hypothetical protein